MPFPEGRDRPLRDGCRLAPQPGSLSHAELCEQSPSSSTPGLEEGIEFGSPRSEVLRADLGGDLSRIGADGSDADTAGGRVSGKKLRACIELLPRKRF
jgi:hypothetical protein